MFYPQTLVRRVESEAVTPLPLAAVGLVALHGTALMPVGWATIARLAAQRGPVWVVDGGNCFDALWVARFLASSTPGGPAPHLALARIHVSRAFTCHQLTERLLTRPARLLQDLPAPGRSPPRPRAGGSAPLAAAAAVACAGGGRARRARGPRPAPRARRCGGMRATVIARGHSARGISAGDRREGCELRPPLTGRGAARAGPRKRGAHLPKG